MQNIENFKVGDTVRVYVKYTEKIGEEGKEKRVATKKATKEELKERISQFEGVVISKKSDRFTVRRISYGVGIEKIFPFAMPNLEKVEVISAAKKRPRRAKLYFMRKR
jgi:large subunit ribosomal protein L19